MSSYNKVVSTIAEVLTISADTITKDTKLSDIAHDSIKLFELFICLENELKGELLYEEIVHVETVGDVVEFLDKHELEHQLK